MESYQDDINLQFEDIGQNLEVYSPDEVECGEGEEYVNKCSDYEQTFKNLLNTNIDGHLVRSKSQDPRKNSIDSSEERQLSMASLSLKKKNVSELLQSPKKNSIDGEEDEDENDQLYVTNFDSSDSNEESPENKPSYMVESYFVPQNTIGFCKIDSGEKQIDFAKVVAYDLNNDEKYEGDLIVTRYKLVFKPYGEEDPHNPFNDNSSGSYANISYDIGGYTKSYFDLPPYKAKFFNVPVHLLYSVDFKINKKNVAETHINMQTKDFRYIRFVLNDHERCRSLYKNIIGVAFPNVLSKDVFALKYQYEAKHTSDEEQKFTFDSVKNCNLIPDPLNLPSDGWEIYNMKREFDRQGIQSVISKFRVQQCWYTDKSKSICETYPEEVYVPAKMTHIDVANCARFRAKRRFPALSYYYKGRGSSLWRSSQNSPGIIASRSSEDEAMLKKIGATNLYTSIVSIYDARSQVKAFSNRVKGGGYENTDHYKNCKIFFCSIDNIHGVTKAYRKMFQAVNTEDKIRDSEVIWSNIEASGWYSLIRVLLETINKIVYDMHYLRRNVLVHCSDGWDRTAEMSSLTQMVLDPYYRTLEGFEVLIEKEFISFGHSFETRCGHLRDDKTKNEKRSEIFVQFLDCVYQLLSQYPTAFEFNVNLLCFLVHHVYTCKFGTFLLDTQKYRFQNKLTQRTISIWTYVNDNFKKFINPFYSKLDEVLQIKSDIITLKVWKEYFFQWTSLCDTQDDEDVFTKSDDCSEMLRILLLENVRLKKQIHDKERQIKLGAAQH